MPQRSLKPCAKPGCPALIREGRYCERHQRRVSAEYDRSRGSASQRGYGASWRKIRKAQLRREPYCADPYGIHDEPVIARQVDHKKPLRKGGTNEPENLQSLCDACHSRKTAIEDGRWR